jgi:hypothetical protein
LINRRFFGLSRETIRIKGSSGLGENDNKDISEPNCSLRNSVIVSSLLQSQICIETRVRSFDESISFDATIE